MCFEIKNGEAIIVLSSTGNNFYNVQLRIRKSKLLFAKYDTVSLKYDKFHTIYNRKVEH